MDEFVQTEFFLKLDAQSLKTIFEPEKVNVNQANLLHAYVRLAEKQCEDNGLCQKQEDDARPACDFLS